MKFPEVPQGTIEKVSVQTESATIHFVEPDGDHEKLILIREDQQWKFWLKIPRSS
jgi:hypothetical protein